MANEAGAYMLVSSTEQSSTMFESISDPHADGRYCFVLIDALSLTPTIILG